MQALDSRHLVVLWLTVARVVAGHGPDPQYQNQGQQGQQWQQQQQQGQQGQGQQGQGQQGWGQQPGLLRGQQVALARMVAQLELATQRYLEGVQQGQGQQQQEPDSWLPYDAVHATMAMAKLGHQPGPRCGVWQAATFVSQG